jgi:hypothetical protein
VIKLSKTSKLDGIMSWSLNALDTCPGSVSTDGGLVPACQGCYATTGNYVFSNVRAPREHNKEDWQRVELDPCLSPMPAPLRRALLRAGDLAPQAFDLRVVICAYVKTDSPLCRVVVTGVTERVVREEMKEIVCG